MLSNLCLSFLERISMREYDLLENLHAKLCMAEVDIEPLVDAYIAVNDDM